MNTPSKLAIIAAAALTASPAAAAENTSGIYRFIVDLFTFNTPEPGPIDPLNITIAPDPFSGIDRDNGLGRGGNDPES